MFSDLLTVCCHGAFGLTGFMFSESDSTMFLLISEFNQVLGLATIQNLHV